MEAVKAVFRSWDNPRANTYRRLNDIPSSWGTAVNVQEMVFGNMGNDCGTGVAFKFAQALLGQQEAECFLPIAAIATIVDIVPLVDKTLTTVRQNTKSIVYDYEKISYDDNVKSA